jgi:probable rRNA maturation factor
MHDLKPDALDITVAIHDRRWHYALPNVAVFCERAIRFVLMSQTSRWYNTEWSDVALEVACVMTDDQEIQMLNSRFRGQDKPTNVLSFEADPDGPCMQGSPRVLGDIIISLDTLQREASEQGKTLQDHAAHMLVHGTLHLLGLDHIRDDEAEIMEKIEVEALSALGVANPYRTSFTA